ncbi:MAG: DUF86 domain-containing protein [Lachnospiraceae bacterium]|nr:DUF86 domain-containing protein [Lachnospiraceae bacterium]
MKYTDEQRITKIKEYTDKLLEYVKKTDINREKIAADETVQWTLTTPLYNIGEHAYYLSDTYKETHSEIPWSKISGLRHRLVHNYEDTNWNIISDILFDVLPDFRTQLDKCE